MPEDLIESPVDAAPEAPIEPEPFTLPEDFATTVQGWDIPVDRLGEAVQQYKALQTEDGVIDAFIATGQSLGFGLKELNRLFQDDLPVAPAAAPQAPAAPVEQLDKDRLMSAAEVEEYVQSRLAEVDTRFQAQEQQAAQQKQAAINNHIGSWFDANGISDEDTIRAIAARGERHILPTMDGYDPRVVTAALEAGKAEYEAWVNAEAQKYIREKGLVAAQQPTSIGGTPTHSQTQDETPVDYSTLRQQALATAKERVRARLRETGELG